MLLLLDMAWQAAAFRILDIAHFSISAQVHFGICVGHLTFATPCHRPPQAKHMVSHGARR